MKVKLKSWVNTHAGTYNLNILIFSRLNGDISAPTTRNYIKLKCPNKHKILMGKVLLFIKLGHKGRERERERVWRRVDVKRVKILWGTPGSPSAGYASSVYLHFLFFMLIFICIFVCTSYY